MKFFGFFSNSDHHVYQTSATSPNQPTQSGSGTQRKWVPPSALRRSDQDSRPTSNRANNHQSSSLNQNSRFQNENHSNHHHLNTNHRQVDNDYALAEHNNAIFRKVNIWEFSELLFCGRAKRDHTYAFANLESANIEASKSGVNFDATLYTHWCILIARPQRSTHFDTHFLFSRCVEFSTSWPLKSSKNWSMMS